ncbi:MAG: peptide deformylase [Eubacteriales bacterium]|nr:peptide deformylase [Eubacteriales bacterium]MDD3350219.1 peptide deformylase [Eubacteriales bacterium]
MALRNIVKQGDEILAKKAREVSEVDDRIRVILDDMIETMRHADGVGLAAPQVGILRQILVIEVDGELIELINPVLLESEGTQVGEEGCLSVPGYTGTVERPAYVKMKGLNRNGKEIITEGRELKAIALCHEYDHLNGVLFVDKASALHEIETDEEY